MSQASRLSRTKEELPYRIELWDADRSDNVERILARALNEQLARAIFKAAKEEHPERRLTLAKGKQIIDNFSA